MNMFLDQVAADAEIAQWKQLAHQRRIRNKKYADEMARLSVPYDVRVTNKPPR
jgi:hypothetical protein